MKSQKFLVCLFIVSMGFFSVSSWGENKEGKGDAAFAPLEEGQEDIQAVIIDGTTKTELKQVSFFGHTTVGGIRSENNSAMTKFDLSNIESLKVINPVFQSKRYQDKEFALVQKVAVGGATEELLVPRNIMICGIEKNTGDEKSWHVHQIGELKVHHTASSEHASLAETKQTEKVASQHEPVKGDEKKKTINEEAQHPRTMVHEQYKKMEVKVLETKGVDKGVPQALREFLFAIAEVIKSVFNFVRHLFVR